MSKTSIFSERSPSLVPTWQPQALLLDENKQTDLSCKYNCCAEMCPSRRFTFSLMKRAHKQTFHVKSQGDLAIDSFFLFFFSQALVLQQYCASNSEVTVFHGMFKAFED